MIEKEVIDMFVSLVESHERQGELNSIVREKFDLLDEQIRMLDQKIEQLKCLAGV